MTTLTQEKRRVGRPRLAVKMTSLLISMTPDMWAWCQEQNERGSSAYIRQLVADDMAADVTRQQEAAQ